MGRRQRILVQSLGEKPSEFVHACRLLLIIHHWSLDDLRNVLRDDLHRLRRLWRGVELFGVLGDRYRLLRLSLSDRLHNDRGLLNDRLLLNGQDRLIELLRRTGVRDALERGSVLGAEAVVAPEGKLTTGFANFSR